MAGGSPAGCLLDGMSVETTMILALDEANFPPGEWLLRDEAAQTGKMHCGSA
jgi:hypothetical protein